MSTAAQTAKDKGNTAFKAGDFIAAIGHYTDATLADRLEPTYPLNRAAAYLKLSKFADAERDCSTALALGEGNVKALFRRAQARIALRKLDDAEKDLNDALAREPANDAVKKELVKLRQIRTDANSSKKTPITVSSQMAGGSSGNPSPSPPIRRRIPIEIVDDDDSKVAADANGTPTTTLLTPLSSRKLNGSDVAAPKSILKTSRPAETPSASFQAARDEGGFAKTPKVSGGIFRQNGTHTLFKGTTASSSAVNSEPPSSNRSSSGKSVPQQLALPVAQADSKATTLFAFEREWNQRPTDEQRWSLLCTVSPSLIPALCKTSLEPEFLVSALATLRSIATTPGVQADVRNAVREYLVGFAQVPRIDTLVMFLSGGEKKVITELLGAVGVREWATIRS